VPPEFQAQNPSYANPPTLLFPLSASIQAIKKAQGALSALSLSLILLSAPPNWTANRSNHGLTS
jgi:hypothetical protein